MNPQMQNLQIWRADCTTFCLSFHPSMDIWVASTSWLATTNTGYKSLCEILLNYFGNIPEVRLWDHMVIQLDLFSVLLLSQAPYKTHKSHWRTFTLLRTSWFCLHSIQTGNSSSKRSRSYFKSGKHACSFKFPACYT